MSEGFLISTPRLDDLARGVDVLIHDAQYTPDEYEREHKGWGHSTWQMAAEAAQLAGVGELVLMSHDPERSDDGVDAILADARRVFPNAQAAYEGCPSRCSGKPIGTGGAEPKRTPQRRRICGAQSWTG